jgi:hypothetical protein
MGAQENIKVIQELMQAWRDRDEKRYSELFTEDAVMRVAGVPRALGGVTQGRQQILANFRQLGPPEGETEVRTIFADDSHVCVVQKISGPFTGTQYFRGSGKSFTTYECFMNFLDVYVQAGLVSLDPLLAKA